jgi:hypothetical protein
MLVAYWNYMPDDPRLATLYFKAPEAGDFQITCAYSLRSSGTKEVPGPSTEWDKLQEGTRREFENLGLEKARTASSGPQAQYSFAKITCSIDGQVNGPAEGDKLQDTAFSNTFLKWERRLSLRPEQEVHVGVFRENNRSDPVRNAAYNTDQNGFLLIGQFYPAKPSPQ